MTDRITDPEVLADLRRRNESERDDSRAGSARNPFASGPDVEHWPCRGGCGRMIGVDASTVENLAIANRKLEARRERPIGKHQVMWCPECKRADDEARAAARRPHEQTEMPVVGASAAARELAERTNRGPQ